MPNKPKTPHRAIRVPTLLWQAAQAKARADGTNLSDLIRGWLAEYVEEES